MSRTLIYKRTHVGDPDEQGRFGSSNCMGTVRSWDVDAVIGIGGTGREPRAHGIAGKLTWIGVGAHRVASDYGAPILMFDHFVRLDSRGPLLVTIVPQLANHFYTRHRRLATSDSLDEEMLREVASILTMAANAQPSSALEIVPSGTASADRCSSRCPGRRPEETDSTTAACGSRRASSSRATATTLDERSRDALPHW